MVDRKVVNIKDIVPLFMYMGNLRVHLWFGILQNLALDLLLGTSVID